MSSIHDHGCPFIRGERDRVQASCHHSAGPPPYQRFQDAKRRLNIHIISSWAYCRQQKAARFILGMYPSSDRPLEDSAAAHHGGPTRQFRRSLVTNNLELPTFNQKIFRIFGDCLVTRGRPLGTYKAFFFLFFFLFVCLFVCLVLFCFVFLFFFFFSHLVFLICPCTSTPLKSLFDLF